MLASIAILLTIITATIAMYNTDYHVGHYCNGAGNHVGKYWCCTDSMPASINLVIYINLSSMARVLTTMLSSITMLASNAMGLNTMRASIAMVLSFMLSSVSVVLASIALLLTIMLSSITMMMTIIRAINACYDAEYHGGKY